MALVMTFAALAAAAWGVSDFLAGLLARRLPVLTILIGSKIAAMLLALVVVAFRGVPPPADPRLWLGVAAGLVGFPAMGLLYRAMRDGSLVVVAPVAAGAALVPVLWGLVHGERLGTVAGLGVVIGLVGMTMASWPVASTAPGRTRRSAQWCSLGAAAGLGGLLRAAARGRGGGSDLGYGFRSHHRRLSGAALHDRVEPSPLHDHVGPANFHDRREPPPPPPTERMLVSTSRRGVTHPPTD
uniref:EamA family transporter n=1 Tax=Paractinoplanes polyasparticus TaxID=2856853 RepID=UPI0027E199D6